MKTQLVHLPVCYLVSVHLKGPVLYNAKCVGFDYGHPNGSTACVGHIIFYINYFLRVD